MGWSFALWRARPPWIWTPLGICVLSLKNRNHRTLTSVGGRMVNKTENELLKRNTSLRYVFGGKSIIHDNRFSVEFALSL